MKAKLKAFFKKIYKEKYYYFFRLPGYFYTSGPLWTGYDN